MKRGGYKHAYNVLHDLTGMNAKRNPNIGNLANNVLLQHLVKKNFLRALIVNFFLYATVVVSTRRH